VDKLNPFLAAMAGAGALLLILAGVLVYPAWDETGTIEKQVKGLQSQLSMAAMDTPGRPDIESWNDGQIAAAAKDEKDYYGKLVWSYKNVANFYLTYDVNLEWWKTHGEPPMDIAKASPEELAKLQRDPSRGDEKKGIQIGVKDETSTEPTLGFNWETNIPWSELKGDEEKLVLKTLQKRYWIRERIANICLSKDLRVNALIDVYFPALVHKNVRTGVGEHPEKYVGDPSKKAGRDRFEEFELPGGLGKTLTFGVTVELPYGEVPKFVRSMLSTDIAPRLLVNILSTRVMIVDQNAPEESYTVDVYENKSADENAKLKAAAKDEFYKKVQPKPVRLKLLCQVIDFDAAKLPDWAKAQLPEWAKPKQN
jgi:hypothetical protein